MILYFWCYINYTPPKEGKKKLRYDILGEVLIIIYATFLLFLIHILIRYKMGNTINNSEIYIQV